MDKFHHVLETSADDIARITRECRSGEIGCIECKEILANVINSILELISKRRKTISDLGPSYIEEVMSDGGAKAREVIQKTVAEAKELVGIPSY
jgi:tryptophanyl-tRNA synthetase